MAAADELCDHNMNDEARKGKVNMSFRLTIFSKITQQAIAKTVTFAICYQTAVSYIVLVLKYYLLPLHQCSTQNFSLWLRQRFRSSTIFFIEFSYLVQAWHTGSSNLHLPTACI